MLFIPTFSDTGSIDVVHSLRKVSGEFLLTVEKPAYQTSSMSKAKKKERGRAAKTKKKKKEEGKVGWDFRFKFPALECAICKATY